MLAYIIRRLLQALLVMIVMSGLVFVGLYVIGDPVSMMASPEATELDREAIRASFGLDKPLWQQYALFMSHAVRLDFGKSFLTGQPAMGLILERMPATLELACVAMLVSVGVGVPLGLWAGLRPQALSARAIMTGSVLGFSLPNFWVGLMLIMVFAVALGWLPAGGRGRTVMLGPLDLSVLTLDGWQRLILPALTIAAAKAALIIRVTRAAVREALPMTTSSSPAPRGCRGAASWACTCSRTSSFPSSRWAAWNSARWWPSRWSPRPSSPGPAWASCCSIPSSRWTARWWWPT